MTQVRHRVGIIGAGVIADFHAQALQAIEGVELVAAFARNSGKAKSFAQKYGCAGYSDLDQFLEHQGMNVVTVGSVSGVHLEHVRAAARAGKHVICEKPLEVTTDRVDEMIRLCEEEGVYSLASSRDVSMTPLPFLRKRSLRVDSVKWFYVIPPSNGGVHRNIMTVVLGGEPGNWMVAEP